MDKHKTTQKIVWTTSLAGVAIAAIFVASSLISGYILRENAIRDRSEQLSNLALVLSEHAAQTMYSGNTALQSLVDEISLADIQSEKAYQEFAGREDHFLSLKEKTQSNAIIDVATYVNKDGKVINFSRSYPAPSIDLSDRDYFQYLSTNDTNDTYYSAPVRNKGNNKWVFYLAKRINNKKGDFLGIALIGISAEVFSKFYERIGSSLGDGSALLLVKNDRTLLTRWPFVEDKIGVKVSGRAIEGALSNPKMDGQVYLTDAPTSLRENERVERLITFRNVDGYPLAVGTVATKELYLASWRHSVYGIIYTTLLSLVLIAIGVRLLIKSYQKNIEVERLANHDLLTNLPNRLLFTDRLKQALAFAKRDENKVAVVYIDLDNLKNVNDQFSHSAGDVMLIEAANRMLSSVRVSDTVARVGGDEFVLILPYIDSKESALLIAEKVKTALALPFIINGKNLAGGASLGVALYPDNGTDETQLIQNADAAMYKAKMGGKNQIKTYDEL